MPNLKTEIRDQRRPGVIRAAWLSVVALAFFAGCSNSVSLEQWRQRVDEFVWQEANGDPNLLRDQTLGLPGSDHRGLAVLGDTDVEKSTDAYGVLLGHKRINGRAAFVFLVGIVSKQTAEDVRLAVLSVEKGKSQWQVSEENDAALEQYLGHRAAAWKSAAGASGDVPASLRSFPAIDDVFRLSVEPGQVSARHVGSGATWTLPLNGPNVARANGAGADKR